MYADGDSEELEEWEALEGLLARSSTGVVLPCASTRVKTNQRGKGGRTQAKEGSEHLVACAGTVVQAGVEYYGVEDMFVSYHCGDAFLLLRKLIKTGLGMWEAVQGYQALSFHNTKSKHFTVVDKVTLDTTGIIQDPTTLEEDQGDHFSSYSPKDFW